MKSSARATSETRAVSFAIAERSETRRAVSLRVAIASDLSCSRSSSNCLLSALSSEELSPVDPGASESGVTRGDESESDMIGLAPLEAWGAWLT